MAKKSRSPNGGDTRSAYLRVLVTKIRVLLTGNKHISTSTLVLERWRVSVNWKVFVGIDWSTLIDWLADNVDDSAESAGTDWNLNWGTSVADSLSSDETLGRVKSDSTDVVTTQMLGDFENESVASSLNLKSIENWWESAAELHIDDGTDNLGNLSSGGSRRSEGS